MANQPILTREELGICALFLWLQRELTVPGTDDASRKKFVEVEVDKKTQGYSARRLTFLINRMRKKLNTLNDQDEDSENPSLAYITEIANNIKCTVTDKEMLKIWWTDSYTSDLSTVFHGLEEYEDDPRLEDLAQYVREERQGEGPLRRLKDQETILNRNEANDTADPEVSRIEQHLAAMREFM